MKPSASLDNWRDYFRRGDCDIFGIIDHAIMVAAADCPKEFKSRRDRIAELLFSCKVSRCIGCDHLELSTAGDDEANHGRNRVETVGGQEDDETTLIHNNQIASNHTYGEGSVIVDEVMRIKDILLNKEDEVLSLCLNNIRVGFEECRLGSDSLLFGFCHLSFLQPNSVLLVSLRKLESMSMSVDLLKDTEIGKAVNGLRRHGSDKISKLAKTLFAEWKELVDQWMNSHKEIPGAEGTPESANFSVVDEAEGFPSPPHDLDFFAPEPNGFELSQILDCLDCDGNPRHSVEPKHERKSQSSARRRSEGTNEANVVGRYKKDQQMRREEVDVRPLFDEPRRQPKQSREQMVHAILRKPIVVAEQKRKLAGSQQDKLKALDPDAKFEFAKRKLQESYQQHEKAKRQRTIQVLETIPKQSKAQKPLLKRPPRR